MRRLAVLSSVSLALALGAVSARAEDPKPRGLAGVGITQEKVDAAIARGVEFLIQSTKEAWPEDGGGFGQAEYDSLVATTLAHSGVLAKDEALARRAMQCLYKLPLGKTYETALVAVALERL